MVKSATAASSQQFPAKFSSHQVEHILHTPEVSRLVDEKYTPPGDVLKGVASRAWPQSQIGTRTKDKLTTADDVGKEMRLRIDLILIVALSPQNLWWTNFHVPKSSLHTFFLLTQNRDKNKALLTQLSLIDVETSCSSDHKLGVLRQFLQI